MPAPRKYLDELRDREVRISRRLVAHVARDLGFHKEALRNWVRQSVSPRPTKAAGPICCPVLRGRKTRTALQNPDHLGHHHLDDPPTHPRQESRPGLLQGTQRVAGSPALPCGLLKPVTS